MIRNLAVFLLLVSASVPGLAKEKYQHPGPIYLDHGGEKWAQKTLQEAVSGRKSWPTFHGLGAG